MFGARFIEAQRHDDTVAADVDPVDQQRHQVEGVERDVEILEFRTGTGFSFNVIPSRGIAIACAFIEIGLELGNTSTALSVTV